MYFISYIVVLVKLACQYCCLCLLQTQSHLSNSILCSHPDYIKSLVHNANCLVNKSSLIHLIQFYLYKLARLVRIYTISTPYLVILSHRSAQNLSCLVCNLLTMSIYVLLVRNNNMPVHNNNDYLDIPNQSHLTFCYFLHLLSLNLRRYHEYLFIYLFVCFDYKARITVDSFNKTKCILLQNNFNLLIMYRYILRLAKFYNFILSTLMHALCFYYNYLYRYFITYLLVSLYIAFTSYANYIMHILANLKINKIIEVLIFTEITLFYLFLYKINFLTSILYRITYSCMCYEPNVLITGEFRIHNQHTVYIRVWIIKYINVSFFSLNVTTFINKNDL